MIKPEQLHLWWRERKMPELSLVEWGMLIPLLRQHQMLARFALRFDLLSKPLPEYAKRHITNACRIAEKQLGQVQYEADYIRSIVKPGQQVVFLKGAAYSLAGPIQAGLGRTYSDIDVLVAKDQLADIEFNLLLHGYIGDELDPYDDMYYRRWAHEIPPLQHAERGTVLDVHHQLLPPISGRAPDLTPFWHNIRPTPQGHWVLGPAAMYLHSTIHLFCNEEIKHGWRDITDLALLAEEFDSAEFWQDLIQLAQTSGFKAELWMSFDQFERSSMYKLPAIARKWYLSYRPTWLERWLWRATYARLLSPSKPAWCWRALLAIRGHWQKMPLPILIKHCLMKLYRVSVSGLLGPQFFIKDKSN